MVIDFKMKPPIPHWESLFEAGKTGVLEVFKHLDVEPTKSNTLEEVLAEMDHHHISSAVILGRDNTPGSANEELLDFLKSTHGERFFGFIGLDNMTVEEAVGTIEQYAETGYFHGVTVTPSKLVPFTPIGDPSLDPIFEKCLEYDLPFCITLSLLVGLSIDEPDYDYIHPKHLIRVAKKYPELKIIISHAAWPFVQDSIALAIHFPNVYLCPDCYIGFPEGERYAEAANKGLENQLLYGSCYPNVPYDFAIRYYREQQWKPGVLEKVLYENARKLLKIHS